MMKLTKAVEKPDISHIKKHVKTHVESPGLWVMDTNWRDRMGVYEDQGDGKGTEMTVGVLCSGQVFGELAVLDSEVREKFSL